MSSATSDIIQSNQNITAGKVESFLLGALIVSLITGIGSAWVIGLIYVPTVEDAHASLVYATHSNEWWRLAWGMCQASQNIIAASALLLLGVKLLERSFHKGQRAAWFALLATLLVFVDWSFFGQMIAWDQRSYHGTIVRLGIIESIPFLGPQITDWVSPNGQLGQSSLALANVGFFGFDAALLLLCTIALFRTRPIRGGIARGIGALIAALAIGSLAWYLPSMYALDIAARPESSMDVRPEWFFLPVSVLLEKSGDSGMGEVALFLPFGLLVLLVVWPYIHGKWFWVLDRLVICASLLAALALMGWKLGEDSREEIGYFRPHDIESIMHHIGELNASFDYADREVPADLAYRSVADLLVLAHQSSEVGRSGSFKKLKDKVEWEKWSQGMRDAALGLWKSPPERLSEARAKFRESCVACHKAYEIDEELFDGDGPPLPITDAAPKPAVGPALPDPAIPNLRFSPEALAAVSQPNWQGQSIKKIMRGSKKELSILNEVEQGGAAQALADLLAQYSLMKPLLAEDRNLGDVTSPGEQDLWDSYVDSVIAALESLRKTSNELEYRQGLITLRKACMTCHDAYEDIHEDPDTDPPLITTYKN